MQTVDRSLSSTFHVKIHFWCLGNAGCMDEMRRRNHTVCTVGEISDEYFIGQ